MPKVKFVQISYAESQNEMGGTSELFALDDKGRIWQQLQEGWRLVESPDEPS